VAELSTACLCDIGASRLHPRAIDQCLFGRRTDGTHRYLARCSRARRDGERHLLAGAIRQQLIEVGVCVDGLAVDCGQSIARSDAANECSGTQRHDLGDAQLAIALVFGAVEAETELAGIGLLRRWSAYP